MKTTNSCYGIESLMSYLQGDASPQVEAATMEHLNDCSICREQLENIAGDGGWWNDAKALLADMNDADLQCDVKLSDSQHTAGDPESAAVAEYLKQQMGPTDDPTKMGRVGHFEVIGILGCGGAGVVLKAHDARLNRFVALKVLLPGLAHNAAARRRFERESRAVAAITHQNVVPIHTVDTFNGHPFIAMQYIAGTSLQQRLDRDGPLQAIEVVRIAVQIARALAAAHAQGIIHRDIKPANILLEGNLDRALVTDFGLARVVDEASTHTGAVAGTPEFMSPEQCHGEPVDHRSDLFSLGAVMYAMCVGRSPFRAETLMGLLRKVCEATPRRVRELNPDIPEWLEAIILRLLEKQPNERFESALDVVKVLDDELAHLQNPTVVARPSRAWMRPFKSTPTHSMKKRNASMILAATVTLGVLLFGFAQNGDEGTTSDVEAEERSSVAAVGPYRYDHTLTVFSSEDVREFKARSGGQFELDADQGNVEILTSDDQQVKVQILRKVAADDQMEADQLKSEHRVEFMRDGKDVKMVAGFDTEFKKLHGPRRFRRITFRVTVPKRHKLNIKTAAGNISVVNELQGDVRVNTAGGNLNLAKIDGSVWAHTSGGNITTADILGPAELGTSGGHITTGDIRGKVEAKTSGGHIKLGRITGSLHAQTSGGNVTLGEAGGAITATTSAGNLTARISTQPKHDCVLRTSAGNISVALGKDIDLNVEAETTVGRISSPFPRPQGGQRSGRPLLRLGDKLHAKLNDGGPALRATTSAGNIVFVYVK